MNAILFRETTTIGVRRYAVERDVLERRMEEVVTPFGAAEVKVCFLGNDKMRYPEYESVKRLAKEQGIAYREMYRIVLECANTKNK